MRHTDHVASTVRTTPRGARLVSAPKAGSRARARDERGGEATERIGWGGCGEVVSGCRGVVVFTRPPYTYESESARDDVAVTGVRVPWVVSVTSPTSYTYWGGRGPTGARLSRSRLGHTVAGSLTPAPGPPHVLLLVLRQWTHLFQHAPASSPHMSSVLENPVVHYGMPAMSAGLVVVVALTLLDGTMQLAALGIAAVEVLVTPQILKRAG